MTNTSRDHNPFLTILKNWNEPQKKKYLNAQRLLWLHALKTQDQRRHNCDGHAAASLDQIVDINFYIVAAQRLLEVAKCAENPKWLNSQEATKALAEFRASWPHLEHVRGVQEHILPSLPGETEDARFIAYTEGNVVEPTGGEDMIFKPMKLLVGNLNPAIEKLNEALQIVLQP